MFKGLRSDWLEAEPKVRRLTRTAMVRHAAVNEERVVYVLGSSIHVAKRKFEKERCEKMKDESQSTTFKSLILQRPRQ